MVNGWRDNVEFVGAMLSLTIFTFVLIFGIDTGLRIIANAIMYAFVILGLIATYVNWNDPSGYKKRPPNYLVYIYRLWLGAISLSLIYYGYFVLGILWCILTALIIMSKD